VTYFYPTLVEGLGYYGTSAQYMTIPIYVAAFICTAISAPLMDKFPDWRGFALGCWMGLAMLCSIIVWYVFHMSLCEVWSGDRLKHELLRHKK
jgi:hypothetical protein